jgi:spore coat protein CotH
MLPFLLSGCGFILPDNPLLDSSNSESESNLGESETESELESEHESESESESEEEEQKNIFEDFFNRSNDVSITLDFSKYQNSLSKFASYGDPNGTFEKQEMYHPLDVTIKINNETFFFEECGARMKGNTSRNPNFVDSEDNIKSLVHFKISFNQTFDDKEDNDYYIKTWSDSSLRKERKDRRLGHVKKFDLKYNKCEDGTFTKQAYAYEAFRSEGLLVEKDNLIKTTIKSNTDTRTEYYLAQECIDKEFLKYHLASDEAKGNLYKATYTSSGAADYTLDSLKRIGVESNSSSPSYDLKTNDDEIDNSLLENLIKTLNNDKSSAANFKTTLDSLVDVESMLKYHALAWVMGNPDDSRMNYNNHYVYFNSKTNKAIFIPYDFDRCLGIVHTWDKDMSSLQPMTTKNIDRQWQKNPLLWRLFLSETDSGVSYSENYPVIVDYQNRYKELVREYAAKYLSNDKFMEFTNSFYNAPNKNVNNAGGSSPSNQTFAYYANNKKRSIEEDTRM